MSEIVGNTHPSGRGMNGYVYYSEGDMTTLTTNKGEGNKIAIPVREATKLGYAYARGGRTPSTLQCREAKQEEDESG